MVSIPVSHGELVDKITILQLKSERISDPQAERYICCELRMLREILAQIDTSSIQHLMEDLATVNQQLWDVEDNIRRHESKREFGADL
jgi:hypothetical protein